MKKILTIMLAVMMLSASMNIKNAKAFPASEVLIPVAFTLGLIALPFGLSTTKFSKKEVARDVTEDAFAYLGSEEVSPILCEYHSAVNDKLAELDEEASPLSMDDLVLLLVSEDGAYLENLLSN